jgi:hypothetical protein
MAELVHEDQEDEPERELPAAEPERVRGEGDEEGEELREQEAPLERGAADHDRQAADPLERPADDPAFLFLSRHRHDPRPIHSSPPV